MTIPLHQLEGSVEHGTWFDGISIEGFTRIAESDQYLMPDMDTFAEIPWQPGDSAGRAAAGTRGHLRRLHARTASRSSAIRAASCGASSSAPRSSATSGTPARSSSSSSSGADEDGAIEPLPHDQAGYFDFSTDLAQEIRQDMVNALEAFGIRVEAAHHEVAAGQHEIDFEYADALRTADNAVTFKFTLKAIAQLHGLYATFMPKPIYGINGSGMHTHQSLYSIAEERNAFADPSNQYGLSDVARSYMAGILAHARGMIAVLAPLVNSYKRLVPGYEAPTYLTWGRTNRSALIRVPKVSPGQVDRGDARRGPLPGPVVEHVPRLRGDARGRPRRRREGHGAGRPGRGEPVRDGRRRASPRRASGSCPGRSARRSTSSSATRSSARRSATTSSATTSRPSAPSGTSTGRRSPTGRSTATSTRSRRATSLWIPSLGTGLFILGRSSGSSARSTRTGWRPASAVAPGVGDLGIIFGPIALMILYVLPKRLAESRPRPRSAEDPHAALYEAIPQALTAGARTPSARYRSSSCRSLRNRSTVTGTGQGHGTDSRQDGRVMDVRPRRSLGLLSVAHAVNHAFAVLLPPIFLAIIDEFGVTVQSSRSWPRSGRSRRASSSSATRS